MNIIGNRKIFLSVSAVLVLASVAAVAVFGLRPGIDLAGGTLWQVRLAASADSSAVSEVLEKAGVKNAAVSPSGGGSFLIRFGFVSEDSHRRYREALTAAFGEAEELRFETIGPAIGSELRRRALWAALLVLLGISFYVAWAFRKVSRPVSSSRYGLITLVTLFHDVVIPMGLFALLGRLYGVEVDTNFIIALLVVMGFSVHDTIVVFDRTRENLLRGGGGDFSAVVNKSVNETFARSVNTSLTLFLVLLSLYFWGPASLKFFVLTILVGTLVGTYSSIFVASPLLIIVQKLARQL